ncbi:DUF3253 domain-containing protein [Qipengyuania aurantiaca]|uniref:DUF3253 domain-containing protein n=1 Tax=Qipengyuania aurantiaca TaxID=2867233 RepID=A0ABX8ZP03_9SPHN|nr:DUF3253 domain-containing protein [Qipengyuania aurantiaca]QZD90451.1 DUF3253 domain-containing protein [Qipengyuania aurantiaca]
MTPEESAVLHRLAQRAPGATLCPSEAARGLAGDSGDWRARMDDVHRAVDGLLEEGRITLSWKGLPMERRNGPYRIAKARE